MGTNIMTSFDIVNALYLGPVIVPWIYVRSRRSNRPRPRPSRRRSFTSELELQDPPPSYNSHGFYVADAHAHAHAPGQDLEAQSGPTRRNDIDISDGSIRIYGIHVHNTSYGVVYNNNISHGAAERTEDVGNEANISNPSPEMNGNTLHQHNSGARIHGNSLMPMITLPNSQDHASDQRQQRLSYERSSRVPRTSDKFFVLDYYGLPCLMGNITGGFIAEWLDLPLYMANSVRLVLALIASMALVRFYLTARQNHAGGMSLCDQALRHVRILVGFELGVFFWMAVYERVIFRQRIPINDVLCWWMLQLAMFLGNWACLLMIYCL